MITISDLKKMLSMEQEIIKEQTQGMNQADTLIQPQPGGNCMNWVLGHMLENQVTLLETLDGVPSIDKAELVRYYRESAPIQEDGEGVKSLDFLLAAHAQLHEAIQNRLDEMSEADFDQEITVRERKVIRGWRIFFLHFHYTYHIGQLELLRNLAGRTDKII